VLTPCLLGLAAIARRLVAPAASSAATTGARSRPRISARILEHAPSAPTGKMHERLLRAADGIWVVTQFEIHSRKLCLVRLQIGLILRSWPEVLLLVPASQVEAMPDRSRIPKRPRDPNQLGKLIVDPRDRRGRGGRASRQRVRGGTKEPATVALGRIGGLKGGKARAAKMTPRQRSMAARKAAKARWGR
jgi:hypothetical protein